MGIEQFADALDEGVGEGVFGDADGRRSVKRRTARTWLHLLGYLERDNEKPVLDEGLQEALASLRGDLGITAEAADLDDRTFSVLTRLASFEPDVDHADRFAGITTDSPALRRAIGLRLYALDLIPQLPNGSDDESIALGLERFAHLRSLLDMPPVDAAFLPATVAALFDLEAMLGRLEAEAQQLTIHHPANAASSARKANRELVSQYVQALARIELWLIGYLTRPRRQMRAGDSTNKSLPHALRQFWRDQPIEARPPASQLEDLDGHFFQRVRAVLSATEDGDDDETIAARLLDDADLARSVRTETRSLGARLFDGTRRAARFILGWIKLRLKGLAALARNLARVMIGRIGNVFSAVREVFLALPAAWRFLTRRPLPGSDPAQLVVLTDGDFDFVLVMYEKADAVRIMQVSQGVLSAAELFASVTAFIDRLAGAFVRVGRRLAFGGWFGAVITLLRARAWLDEMNLIIERVRAARTALAA